MTSSLRISFAGAGNAAFRLSIALKSAGFEVPFIWGRNEKSGVQLASILNKHEYNPLSLSDTAYASDISELNESDVIILAVSDDAIKEVFSKISLIPSVVSGKTVVCHTSGATSISAVSSVPSYGVFYPLMTLSKAKPVDMKIVPFLLEVSDENSRSVLVNMTESLGSEYMICNSDERMRMHVAAVFVSNFVNYMAALAYDVSVPHHVFLLPLAIETVRKAFLYGHPSLVQTGPAVRGDISTIEKHLDILEDTPEHRQVYELLSKLIASRAKTKK